MAERPRVLTNIHDAKAHFSKLLKRVSGGEEVVIARAGHPIAKLVPYVAPTKPRQGGCWRGLVHIRADFDAPLPSLIQDRR
ncbi:MAG: type II toxin-antitoxin system prevent-host-death family antitoxin [Phycisphaerales bacterium]